MKSAVSSRLKYLAINGFANVHRFCFKSQMANISLKVISANFLRTHYYLNLSKPAMNPFCPWISLPQGQLLLVNQNRS